LVERIESGHTRDLWPLVSDKAGLSHSEFERYFSGTEQAHALFFSAFLELQRPIPLSAIREAHRCFHPPQTFRYLQLESCSPDIWLSFVNGVTIGFRFDDAVRDDGLER
jgi:hypothetical protein